MMILIPVIGIVVTTGSIVIIFVMYSVHERRAYSLSFA